MNKKSLFGGLGAIVLAALILVSISVRSSASNSSSPAKRASSTWHFIGSDQSQMLDDQYWVDTNPQSPDCSSQRNDLPCTITVSGQSFNTAAEFVSYLNDTYGGNTTDILDAAQSWRPQL